MMERRTYPRVEVFHPIRYYSDIHPRSVVTSTLNLSMGGTRIETINNLVLGEKLAISLAIPQQLIKCSGKVVHLLKLLGERVEVGVRFEDLSNGDRLYLGKYISHVTEKRCEELSPSKGIIIGLGLGLLLWVAIAFAIIVFIVR